MTESRKETLDAIMRALELEKETFDFYVEAEQKTFHPAGKRMFRWLAKTEEEHYLRLNELYSSLHEGGRWVFYGGSTITLDAEGADHVGFGTDDLEALKVAMDIERKGIDFFESLAARTSDPDGKAMLERLRDEEKEHLRVIEEKYTALTGN
ncbi:ferritin family protein [Geobacter sp. DSM 9736]|uniref:ferritin family protein n=1 Tax=Geobacter sp. DSM 9736 TaxID=1277350 RepID=UPI000B5F51E8|nr:ferritin family protein [Geobacter sp. DSM 9736]SNB46849.1 Rubrerythrin [Geobacter sp. DSM 9736]